MTKDDREANEPRSAHDRRHDHGGDAVHEGVTRDHDRRSDDADDAARAESARVAGLTPGDNRSPDGSAPVEPHTEMFPHQPHGQAGQPQNRPASEGHQGMTPIQPDDQDLRTGISPTEAITHGEPNEIVDTTYTVHAGAAGASSRAGHDKKDEKKGHGSSDSGEGQRSEPHRDARRER